jgi:hypothetical protein
MYFKLTPDEKSALCWVYSQDVILRPDFDPLYETVIECEYEYAYIQETIDAEKKSSKRLKDKVAKLVALYCNIVFLVSFLPKSCQDKIQAVIKKIPGTTSLSKMLGYVRKIVAATALGTRYKWLPKLVPATLGGWMFSFYIGVPLVKTIMAAVKKALVAERSGVDAEKELKTAAIGVIKKNANLMMRAAKSKLAQEKILSDAKMRMAAIKGG